MLHNQQWKKVEIVPQKAAGTGFRNSRETLEVIENLAKLQAGEAYMVANYSNVEPYKEKSKKLSAISGRLHTAAKRFPEREFEICIRSPAIYVARRR